MYSQTKQNKRGGYRIDTTHRETITIPFHRMKLVNIGKLLPREIN